SFTSGTSQTAIYVTCTPVGDGCAYAFDDHSWNAVAQSSAGVGPVTYRVRGASRTSGAVGASATQTIEFATEAIMGGLYSGSAGAMTCVGCHVLSRDGRRIAVGMDIPAPSPFAVFDVATRAAEYRMGSFIGGGGANFFAFSPDASQMLTSNGVSITLRDTAS